ncbi:MAG TPA: hypothetical protein ENH62_01120 [Marinobacter sp.]|uniref:Uncharacterized protein n=1 Tax=marine sediment metagenome TaxID=412755 RepID=A0A0F9QPV0_9ZZZZ|nr:hypothetical protein [Marinobacter sp.]
MAFTSLPRDNTKVPIQIGTLGGTSTLIDFGASATTATGVFTSPLIRLVSTANVHISTGAAATTDMLLISGVPEYFGVSPDDTLNLISETTGTGVHGVVYITEM